MKNNKIKKFTNRERSPMFCVRQEAIKAQNWADEALKDRVFVDKGQGIYIESKEIALKPFKKPR